MRTKYIVNNYCNLDRNGFRFLKLTSVLKENYFFEKCDIL